MNNYAHITRDAESLTRMVEENLNSESNLRYLSNSIHAERLRTGSAKEMSEYGKSFLKAEDAAAGFTGTIPKIAPIL